MSPKPDEDDLFIEPAEDEDVVYGDYNSTMDGSSTGQRPYIRLTSQLKNTTRNAGTDIRFKCEAVGTPPVVFTWLKNHAPLEKSSRIKEKHRDTSSRLTINKLDVLDSGYYQCIASNAAASVNSTSVLRVNNVPDSVKSRKGNKIDHSTDYEDYELMDRGRLPDEEDSDLYRVPDSAGGEGYQSSNTDRWLDGIKYQKGDCVPYRGEACRLYLSGRYIALTQDNREDMYDIDRNIRAGIMVINSLPSISPQCRTISQEVACFHMYKVCDGTTTAKAPLTICKTDCEKIQNDVCKNEFALAAQHELVGDNQKAMFPSCPKLPITKDNCIPIIQKQPVPSVSDTSRNGAPVHWCYVNTGTTYEGAVSTTESGKICENWEESTSREFNVHRYPELRRARNNCRNPGGKKARPWCFTKGIGQEEYCDITECPKEMYPHLQDKTTNSSPTDSFLSAWDGLSQSWQIAIMGGGVGLLLILFLLFCCCCCCKTKKKTQKTRNNTTNNQHLSAPPSIINSAGTSTYYRKLNGTSTPIMGRPGGPMEMTSLLSGNGQVQNQLGTTHPPPYMEQYEQPQQPYHIPEITGHQLLLGDIIGEGQFGIIQTGTYIGGMISGGELQVAVKSLRLDATNADKASLEAEIRIVAEFEHDNVIKLIGVTYQPGLAAVFNYMVHGDLHDLLRLRAPNENFDRIPDMEEFMNISTQISCGMDYLSSMGFVHRDLSARNCLVADNRIIKIAPFGIMRKCYEQCYYKIPHRPWLAVRWQPREAVEVGRFTAASDVWAFGVTLWEIWSYGRQPYENATNQQVIDLIANRILLECPHNCPTNIYSLMVECWHENPDRRPSFSEISSRLQQWSMASPAHSILNPARNSNSSQSGSSNSGRPPVSKALGRSQPSTVYPPVRGRRQEDASPLMRRDNANYTYSDGESDD